MKFGRALPPPPRCRKERKVLDLLGHPMSIDYKKRFEEIDLLIRNARGKEAQVQLTELHKKRISKVHVLEVAKLATRAGMPELALSLLHPIVRPSAKMVREATDTDKAEYGLALLRVGACAEANTLFKTVSCERAPEVLFYRALSYLKEWDYAAASKLLKEYCDSPNLSSYQRLVGKINLAISLIFENNLNTVKMILAQVLEESSAMKLELSYAVGIRLHGNLEMRRKNWNAALSYFQTAEELLRDFGGFDWYFAKKWKALVQYFENPENEEAKTRVLETREAASRIRHWESVRDIDYHLALYSKNKALFWHLYFGTPYEHFRNRILAEMGDTKIPESYEWKFGEGKTADFSRVDIAEQQKTKQGTVLKVGKSLHRLYMAFLSDFYRPFTIGALFENAFPGEHYHPTTSEYRVHQAIKNLRLWFKKNSIPLTILYENDEYRLISTANCIIPIQKSQLALETPEERKLSILRTQLSGDFSRLEVAVVLSIERSTANRLLLDATKRGILEKVGTGSKTRYRFVDSFKKAA